MVKNRELGINNNKPSNNLFLNSNMSSNKTINNKSDSNNGKLFATINDIESSNETKHPSAINDSAASSAEKKIKTTGPIHNSKYKMKLCEKYESEGVCPYYEKCQFAHGEAEMEKWNLKRKQASMKQEKSQSKTKNKQAKSPSNTHQSPNIKHQKQPINESLSQYHYHHGSMPQIDLALSSPFSNESNNKNYVLKPTTKPWFPKNFNPSGLNQEEYKLSNYQNAQTSSPSFIQSASLTVPQILHGPNRKESLSNVSASGDTLFGTMSSPSSSSFAPSLFPLTSSGHDNFNNPLNESSIDVQAIVRELSLLQDSLNNEEHPEERKSNKSHSDFDNFLISNQNGQRIPEYQPNMQLPDKNQANWETDSASASASISNPEVNRYSGSILSNEKISPFLSPMSSKSYSISPSLTPFSISQPNQLNRVNNSPESLASKHPKN